MRHENSVFKCSKLQDFRIRQLLSVAVSGRREIDCWLSSPHGNDDPMSKIRISLESNESQ